VALEATFTVRGLPQLIKRAHDGFDGPRDRFLEDVADAWLALLEQNAPRGRTGQLWQNHHIEFRGSGTRRSLVAVNTMPYAPYVVYGTRPHDILPRHPAEALYWPGAPHPVAIVHHPGTKPNTYMDTSTEQLQGQIDGPLSAAYYEDARRVWDGEVSGEGP
jgi:hypothetical protein